ncbi:MAG: glycoside hydrolase family 3 N-terminal domain-containing protein [Pseudomonadota bacterium]
MPIPRAVIFGCAGPRLSPEEFDLFAQSNPWGFILFARNLETPNQIATLCSDMRRAVGWHAPILIDQEGGRVERLGQPHWHSFAPPLDDADHAQSERLFWTRGALIGSDLAAAGINVNCAPCCDVAVAKTHPFLRNRCYGTDRETVITHAKAMIAGHAHAGVASVIKHMPGHGRGTLDSHLELPRVSASRQDLEQDFAPFRALADAPMAMTGHMVVEALDAANPATQSKTVVEFMRTDIGFGGLIMTDDISMNALAGTVVDRSLRALDAGCDTALHCNGDMDEMRALAAHVPVMSGGGLDRAKHACDTVPDASAVDIPAIRAERAGMLGTRA